MKTNSTIIGRAVNVDFPELGLSTVPARVDTGAKTSAVWATNIVEKDRTLHFVLFDNLSPFYTGQILTSRNYTVRVVSSSTGHVQERYAVKLLVNLAGKQIRATFTLADRSMQVYPILIGRNILIGKFIVDVKLGEPLIQQERIRTQQLRRRLLKRKEK
jgi:hypothetical protein